MNPWVVTLGIIVLVALAVVVWAYRTRSKPQQPFDVSLTAYERDLRKWQHDYAAGTDKRPDFPSRQKWVAEQTWKYYDEHGVWPGEEHKP